MYPPQTLQFPIFHHGTPPGAGTGVVGGNAAGAACAASEGAELGRPSCFGGALPRPQVPSVMLVYKIMNAIVVSITTHREIGVMLTNLAGKGRRLSPC